MSPRIPLTAAAYALAAQGVVGLDTIQSKVRTHYIGTGLGQIPTNNNALNSGLNADMLDGKHWNDYLIQMSRGLWQENPGCSTLLSTTSTCSATRSQCGYQSYPALPTGCTNVSTWMDNSCCGTEGCDYMSYRSYTCPNTFWGYLRTPCTNNTECPSTKPTCNTSAGGVCQ
jgi:hypothetical protein